MTTPNDPQQPPQSSNYPSGWNDPRMYQQGPQQPPQGPGGPPGNFFPPNAAPPAPPKKKHTFWKVVLGIVVVIILIVVLAKSCGGGGPSATVAPADSPAAQPTGKASHPSAKHTKKPAASSKVAFKVTGSAPNGVDITYGSDSDNLQGGNTTPWKDHLKVKKDSQYYYVTAQLNGKGSLKCSITIGDVVARGTARGSYNVCTAQLGRGLFGGWEKE